jgi:hypothetical protein
MFWFALYELYTPKWSKHIFDEWIEVSLTIPLFMEGLKAVYPKLSKST